MLAQFEGRLATQRWLTGSNMGLADCFALPMIEGIAFFDELVPLLGDYPMVTDWHARIQARPSVATTFSPRTA